MRAIVTKPLKTTSRKAVPGYCTLCSGHTPDLIGGVLSPCRICTHIPPAAAEVEPLYDRDIQVRGCVRGNRVA